MTTELHDFNTNAELKEEIEKPTLRDENKDENNDKNDTPNFLESPHGCFMSVLLWYITPISYDLKYSFGTYVYQFLNFGLAWGLFSYCVAAYTVAIVSLIFIVGFLVLSVVLEISILLAKFDLMMTIFFVEHNPELRKKNAIRLALDSRHIPPCGFSCMAFWGHLKFILTSCSTYGMIIYQLIIKVVFSMTFGWSAIILTYVLAMIIMPIWYGSFAKFFDDNTICLFGSSGDSKHCVGLHVKNFGSAFLVFFIGIALLPLAAHFNNMCCKVQKIITYYFLTDHYRTDQSDRQTLINVYGDGNGSKQGVTTEYPQYTVNSAVEV